MSNFILTNSRIVGRLYFSTFRSLTLTDRSLTYVALRSYSSSSSSSSSSSTKKTSSSSSSNTKNNTTPTAPQKQELSFVHVNHIHPKDLAQTTFYAGHRPLLSFDSEQMQQNGQNKQILDDEDYEEENSGSNVNSILLNNPLSPYLTPSPFHPSQPIISSPTATAAELKFIVSRYLSKIELKLKQKQLADSSNERRTTVIGSDVDNVKQKKEHSVTVYSKRKRDKIIYFTNIVQKRRLKMKKHKLRKLRKRDRALRKRLGKS